MQLCSLLKSRVDSPDFLEKLENCQVSVPHNMTGMFTEECVIDVLVHTPISFILTSSLILPDFGYLSLENKRSGINFC